MRKQNESAPPSLSAALSEAQAILDSAEERARSIIVDADRVREEARAQGESEGQELGKKEALQVAVRLLEDRALIQQRLSEEAARLALRIAATVIERHVESDESVVIDIAKRALRETVVEHAATIISHPKDKQILQQALDQLRRVAGGAEIKLETDASLGRGGCVVRTEFGEADASIEALLGSVQARLGVKSRGK